MSKKNYGIDMNGNVMDTQLKVVKNYLLQNPGVHRVSHKTCEEMWGFTRLSAIIHKMKDQFEADGGKYVINDARLEVVTRWGVTTHPKEYWVEKVA